MKPEIMWKLCSASFLYMFVDYNICFIHFNTVLHLILQRCSLMASNKQQINDNTTIEINYRKRKYLLCLGPRNQIYFLVVQQI